MATIFDLSVADLYSLAVALLPGMKEQLNPEDQVSLRTRITEWLLLHNFSTLHKFHKTEDSWSFPTDYSCDSCRKKKEEHKYTPKPRVKSPEVPTTSLEPLPPVLAGDEFITFEVKNQPKIPSHLASKDGERDSLSGYYSSATDCLFAFGSCLFRPFRICFIGRSRE